MERRWIAERARTYDRETVPFWTEFFEAERVKVFCSWFKYTETHCAIGEAVRRAGGVSAIYQRAYESHPSAETAVVADVAFVFSNAVAETERRSGSHAPYIVVTGYLGDFRFALLRETAAQIRQRLQARGARRILAFTDEGSADDERWHTGHQPERENYAFLLERALGDPRVGLVIKPKTPHNLRRRLGGEVAGMLDRARATGRCFIFEKGTLQGSYPPAAAALAADVMVHGHLCAATAGMESALAGVPTLLVDREGWSASPLYRLGEGRVVFKDWAALWRSCEQQWEHPGSVQGFGDWSPVLHDLDPFRDGRAAERMGAYLAWLLDGFAQGKPREAALEAAADRYARAWGADKVSFMTGDAAQRNGRSTVRDLESEGALV
jgi:hypothetical protein